MANVGSWQPDRLDTIHYIHKLAESRVGEGYSVISGCDVHENVTPDMDVVVDSGEIFYGDVYKTVAGNNVTISAADGTNDRIDVIYVDSSGVAQVHTGDALAVSDPLGNTVWTQYESPYPKTGCPAGVIIALVYVPANDTSIENAQIEDIAQYNLIEGITALNDNVTQADGKYIATDKIRARNGDGLDLQDDDGNGIFVKDGGNVGIGTTAPNAAIYVSGGMACGGSNAGTGYGQGNLGEADITFLKNTAMLLVGWNRSSGQRETAFITNPRGATGGTMGGFSFIMYEDDGTETVLVTVRNRAGDVWIAGDCSAQTFTDRCKFPTGIDALAAIRPIKGDGKGGLDHASLPDCVRVRAPTDIFEEQDVLDEKTGKPKLDETGQKITERIKVGEEIEEGRDLGAMVSVLTKAVQELEAIVKAQAVEIAALKKVAGGRT